MVSVMSEWDVSVPLAMFVAAVIILGGIYLLDKYTNWL